jgi:hypothetical protein
LDLILKILKIFTQQRLRKPGLIRSIWTDKRDFVLARASGAKASKSTSYYIFGFVVAGES